MEASKLKIESGIPVTPRSKRGYSGLSATLRNLKKGDSVFVPKKTQGQVASIAQYAIGVGNYTVRTEKGGARVWRTA